MYISLGIFFSKMNNGIQNRFSLLSYIFNKVQFRIFLCNNVKKLRCYASLKKTFFFNGSAANSISAAVFTLVKKIDSFILYIKVSKEINSCFQKYWFLKNRQLLKKKKSFFSYKIREKWLVNRTIFNIFKKSYIVL